MKISELQELLEKAKEEYGDVEVVYYDCGRYNSVSDSSTFSLRGETVLELE